ncbi:MAG: Trk system potassium transporter TrkA [Firmicutes bacterium]|nr:Trk system potassium transporter TrkA [Bacillota bacterium]
MKVLIVGAGKLGYKLAQHMILEDIDVVLMDNNPKVLERINEHIDVLTLVGDGIDIKMLKELNIKNYDLLVASTNSDESNALICSIGKRLGAKKTIARIRNPKYMEQLDFIKGELGIDLIVNPDLATAQAIEKYLLKSYSFYSNEFASGRVEMLDYNISHHKAFVGKNLSELKDFESLLIAAISRDGAIIIPHGSTVLEDNDIIYIIGDYKDIDKFNSLYNLSKKKKAVDNVMILGGSNIGYYLAERLSKSRVNVRLIEKDKERAQELSDILNNVLIIYGDGTDINLLEEENLDQMDAFIGTTGFDEENLLMALMAKQAGVADCIAKISRENYTKIIDRLDIDVALNPLYITVSNILKNIRGGKVVSVSLLLGGDAEVTELIVGEDSLFLGKSLHSLNLPKGIIIGAIVRKGEVIIPKGDSIIMPKDRIVVFSLTEDLPTLKLFFKAYKGGVLGELWHRTKGARHPFNN